MDLLNALLKAADTNNLQSLGSQFGLDESSVNSVLGEVVPALGRGIQKNTQTPSGLESLLGALNSGGHERYLGDISSVASQAGISDGNNILGHVFGSKDVSRNVAAQASQTSGVSSDIIKQMLPMIATMVMGTLGKQTESSSQLAGQTDSGGLGDMLSSMLDADGDGSPIDDVLDMAKKFF
jgi:hypothetical protein